MAQLFCCLVLISSSPLSGHIFSRSIKTKEIVAKDQTHLKLAQDLFDQNEPMQALQLLKSSIDNLPFPLRPQALFLMGKCQFQTGEWDLAAAQFSKIVESEGGGDLLGPSLEYLWQIAENYRSGLRHHFLGYKSLPRWSSNRSLCLPIYNQIAEALPYAELAEKALMAKGQYLRQSRDFGHSNEAFSALIMGFPNSLRSAEAFCFIGDNLLDLMKLSPGDEELIASATGNLESLQSHFPQNKIIENKRGQIEQMRSLFADDLVKTGRFYERKKKPGGAKVYYQRVVDEFPQTDAKKRAEARLFKIDHLSRR